MPHHAHRARRARAWPLVPVVLVTLSVIGIGAAAGALRSNQTPTSGEHSAAVRGHHDQRASDAPTRLSRYELRLRERAAAAMQRRVEPLTRSASRTHEHHAKPEAKPTHAAKKATPPPPPPDQPFDVTVGTFNVLGSQHTAKGGDRTRFPPASVRSPQAAALMIKHGLDIVGTQELQTDQLSSIESHTGFTAYPGMAWGSAETDNSILYDPDKFEYVSGSKFIIPFMGRPRPQPILRLRDRATGREFYVVNTHPSAHDGKYEVERRQGEAALVNVVNSLQATGLPVLVTGDMNDREAFYCHVAPQAGLVSASGGSYSSGCSPPPEPVAVDWVLGSGVTWSGYWRDTTPVTRRISDHFMVSATAHFG